MKTVVYRDGLVSFDLPSTWQEDLDPAGSARFYEEGEDTGTMRLNVLSFEREAGLPREHVARSVFQGETFETLPGGFALRHHLTEAEEGGELLHVYRWDVLVAVSPKHWRLACFGYTALASQAGEDRTKEELFVVNRAVRTARYSTDPAPDRYGLSDFNGTR